MDKCKYAYSGQVMQFGKLIKEQWTGTTMAVSEKKARSNLAYQFKRDNNLMTTAQVTFPGELKLMA